MKEISDIVACVIDHSLFLPIALKLAEQYKLVYYWTPHERAFPTVKEGLIGDGFENLARVDDFWDIKKNCDVFVFPDIGFSGLQLELEAQGFPVWGGRTADKYETNRGLFLRTLEQLGLPVPVYETARGVTALARHLHDQTDRFVKVSRWRGDCETFHWRDWAHDEATLDFLAFKLGPLKEQFLFYIFDPIDTDIEDGVDTHCINGQLPSVCLHAMEAKDKALLGTVVPFKDIPEEVRMVSETFAPVLAKHNYRGFFSTEVRIADGTSYFLDPTCFSDDTEVLSSAGWKLFRDLNPNDSVATLNPSTGQIEYHIPSHYIAYHFCGDMVLLSNKEKTIECLVTPNHSVWRTDRNGNGLFREDASSLTDRGYIPRTGTWVGIRSDTYTVPNYLNQWIGGRWGNTKRIKQCEPVIIPMNEWLEFLGLYIAEGSISRWGVSIAQYKHLNKVEHIIRSTGLKYSKLKSGFQISNVQLRDHLISLGLGTCSTKFVPMFVKALTPPQIRRFLNGHRIGDGSVHKGQNIHYTTSRRLADDIQELIFKTGGVSRIERKPSKGTVAIFGSKKYIRNHDIYRVCETMLKTRFWFESASRKSQYISHHHYDGMVYDVTVANHILYVRRNGKPFWSGNCRAGSPPSQLQTELYANLGQIIWAGANGECVDPRPNAEFGVQALLTANVDKGCWKVHEFPAELRQWVKCSTACEVDGRICQPPDDSDDIGWLVAIGDTIEQAIATLKDHIEKLPDGVHCDCTGLVELLEEVKSAEEQGMKFTDHPVPEPASVVANGS